jgi:hypothetical protein
MVRWGSVLEATWDDVGKISSLIFMLSSLNWIAE